MLNYLIINFLYSWLTAMVFLFILNLSIKAYKFLKYNYLFDVSVERLTNVNGKLVRTSFIFSNIYSSPYIKWGSDRSIIKLFDVVLNIIYNNPTFRNDYSNKKLIFTIYGVNKGENPVALSIPIYLKYEDFISSKDLLNKVNNTYVAISDPII